MEVAHFKGEIYMKIYIIRKLQIDSMENHPIRAVSREIIGFVKSEIEAKDICKSGKTFNSDDCWALIEEEQEFDYLVVEELDCSGESC